jgi:IS5 family transposase
MGLCLTGLDAKLTATTIQIHVPLEHPYIKLANTLDWRSMTEIILNDLKRSTLTRLWWVGRKLFLRPHLGAFILQALTKMTDRHTEEMIRGNALYQAFCGKSIMDQWKCPDHTSIEKFRNRITPPTQQKLVSYVVTLARGLGFADPSMMDVDSTVQESAMAYPSDAHLLTKLAYKCKKVIAFVKTAAGAAQSLDVDIKAVKKKAKEYFFLAKNKSIQIKRQIFKELYTTVKQSIAPAISECLNLTQTQIRSLPWNIQRAIAEIRTHAGDYLQAVAHFIKTHTLKAGKILSFRYLEVACITKGKVGKDKEFGRVYQLGRIGGNFLIVLPSTSVRQDDKASLIPMVKEHQNIFGENVLDSLGADKGYFTKANVCALRGKVKNLGIQCPGNVKIQDHIPQALKDRRAGIEPLIGHVKKFGLGKSKAKSDTVTLASGYRSVFAFNLHQLTRYLSGKAKKATT